MLGVYLLGFILAMAATAVLALLALAVAGRPQEGAPPPAQEMVEEPSSSRPVGSGRVSAG